MPPQRAHTNPPPASPLPGPGGPACGGPTQPRGCPQTMTPECDGTSLSNVHLPPLQIPRRGLGAWAVICDQRVRGNLAEKPPERPPDALLQWKSMSLCLKAGVPALLTKSTLRWNKLHLQNIQ